MGWGFVVRGSSPCHIQAVDPSGPAAAAGMKVRNLKNNGKHKQGKERMVPLDAWDGALFLGSSDHDVRLS